MKSLRESGRPVPHPFSCRFSRRWLRRSAPLIALVAAFATQARTPASALRAAFRVGFQLPGSAPITADLKNEAQLVGAIRTGSSVPLTVAVDGGDTGDAQMVVTSRIGTRRTTYTRAIHLTGAAQVFRVALAGQEPLYSAGGIKELGAAGSVNIEFLQNGRRLTGAMFTTIPSSLDRTSYNVLALTGRPNALKFLRESDIQLTHHGEKNNATEATERDKPRLLSATPESLPESAQALDAIDAIVLEADYLLNPLTPDQQEAIREYVRQGGRLILVDPQDRTPVAYQQFLASLGTGPFTEVAYTDAKAKNYGAGIVFAAPNTLLTPKMSDRASPLGAYPMRRDYQDFYDAWYVLLGGTDGSAEKVFSPKQTLTNAAQFQNSSEMTDALAGQQAAQTVPFPLVTGFLFAYIVLIIPANYLILKKLDRRELAWVTAPALVFLFSGASYAVAHAIKGGNLTVNRAVVYEAFANTDAVTGQGQFTLYSPRRAAYDISIGDPGDAANPYRNILPTETTRSERSGGASDLTVARDASLTLKGVSVPIWDTRSFNLPVTGSLGGGLEARGTLENGSLRYLLTNHTRHDLRDCCVVVGDQVISMSDIKAGESASAVVAWNGNIAPANTSLNLPYLATAYSSRSGFSLNQADATAEETQARIREAMQNILRTNPLNDYNAGSRGRAAVCAFMGWFDAKTLDVRVDGKSAAGEQENMLYVHLPLPANAKINGETRQARLNLIPKAADAATNDATTTQEVRDAE